MFSPLIVKFWESNASSGAGGTPPFPLTVNPFFEAASRLAWQAWAVVSPGSTMFCGSSIAPWRGLILEVLIVTFPSKLKSELALISFVESFKAPSLMPNNDSALILIFPPIPLSELAIMSLLPSGKAIINLASMFKFPPLASSVMS